MAEWTIAEWKDLIIDGAVCWAGPIKDDDRPHAVAATEKEAQRLCEQPGYAESDPYLVSVSDQEVLFDGGQHARDTQL